MKVQVEPLGIIHYTYFSQAQISPRPDCLGLDHFGQNEAVNRHFAYGQLSTSELRMPVSTSDSFILPS